MVNSDDILLVGQTPQPYHGQAVVTAMLFDHDWGDLKVESLNWISGIAFMGLLTAACIMRFTRSRWVCLRLAPVIVFAFRFRVTTIAAYGGGIALFLSRYYFFRMVFN